MGSKVLSMSRMTGLSAPMASLVIGCPIAGREWMFERWIEATYVASVEMCLIGNPLYVFVVPEDDRVMMKMIAKHVPRFGSNFVIITHPGDALKSAQRTWFLPERLEHMSNLRNLLLNEVRSLAPDIFWSLDSDLLAKPDSLQQAINALCMPSYAAVGMRTYMTPTGTEWPSNAQLINGILRNRADTRQGTHQVDVIMASKVMSYAAYSVDYQYHELGEDVGWSIAMAKAGLKLGWCADAVCKHIMSPALLDVRDPRVGF